LPAAAAGDVTPRLTHDHLQVICPLRLAPPELGGKFAANDSFRFHSLYALIMAKDPTQFNSTEPVFFDKQNKLTTVK